MNENLMQLMQAASKKNYEFHYFTNEDEYNLISVDNDEKIVYCDIGLPENEDMPVIIKEALTKLE